MTERAEVFSRQQDFIAAIAHLPAGLWRVNDDATFYFQRLSARSQTPGVLLCLTLMSGRRYSDGIRQVLQQRFQQAEALGECYLSMDARQRLILRRTLPISAAQHPQAVADLLRLAGLPPA